MCHRWSGIFATICARNRKSKSHAQAFNPYLLCTIWSVVCATDVVCLCSGHDCGVYVMAFMDVLSIKTDALYFDSMYVPHMRDLCLLSILDGKIAHFPEALQVCEG